MIKIFNVKEFTVLLFKFLQYDTILKVFLNLYTSVLDIFL